jgi:hypothetical protein
LRCADGAAEPDWARTSPGSHRTADNTEIGPSHLSARLRHFQFIVSASACAEALVYAVSCDSMERKGSVCAATPKPKEFRAVAGKFSRLTKSSLRERLFL